MANFRYVVKFRFLTLHYIYWGHGGAVVTHSPPTSEVGGSNPEPQVGKMVVFDQWLVVYSTEINVLLSSAHKTTHRDMT